MSLNKIIMFNFKLIQKFLFPNKIHFFLRLIFIVFNGLLELIGISLLLFFIKIISSTDEVISFFQFKFYAKNYTDIIFISLIIICFYLLKNFYIYWFVTSQQKILSNAQLRLGKNIYYGYIKSKLNLILGINTKKIIQDINVETEKLFYEYFQSLFTLLTETIIIFLILVFFLINEPIISIYLVILSVLIYFLAAKIFFSKSSLMGQNRIKSFEELSNIVNSSIGLFKELKVSKKITLFSKLFDKSLTRYVKSKYFDNVTSELPKTLIEIFVVVIIISIVLLFFLLEKNVEELIPILSMFAIGSIRIMPSINRVAVASHNMKFYGETISGLSFDLDYFNFAKDRDKIKKNFSVKNKIYFKKVSYFNSKKEIFKNLNCEINFKDKVLVLGKSGSGKTTFLKILSGLVPITNGSIENSLEKTDSFLNFKEPISYLTQDNFVIDKKSIFYNVTLKDKKNARLDDIKKFQEVIKLANVNLLISRLPQKEDTILNEAASNISGGEKQRICIARAFFSDNDMIIMDEPFSSIDKQNSDEIFHNILRNAKNKTLVITNHKKIDKKYFDKVIIFKNNEIKIL